LHSTNSRNSPRPLKHAKVCLNEMFVSNAVYVSYNHALYNSWMNNITEQLWGSAFITFMVVKEIPYVKVNNLWNGINVVSCMTLVSCKINSLSKKVKKKEGTMVFHILWHEFLFTHLSFFFNFHKIIHSLNFFSPTHSPSSLSRSKLEWILSFILNQSVTPQSKHNLNALILTSYKISENSSNM